MALRILDRTVRALPARRIPNANRGGNGLRIGDGMTIYNRRGTGSLKSKHPRQSIHAPGGIKFFVPLPVGSNVSRVADRQKMKVRRPTKLIANFECRRFLAFNADRIDA